MRARVLVQIVPEATGPAAEVGVAALLQAKMQDAAREILDTLMQRFLTETHLRDMGITCVTEDAAGMPAIIGALLCNDPTCETCGAIRELIAIFEDKGNCGTEDERLAAAHEAMILAGEIPRSEA